MHMMIYVSAYFLLFWKALQNNILKLDFLSKIVSIESNFGSKKKKPEKNLIELS